MGLSPAERGMALMQGAAIILLLSSARRKKQRNIHLPQAPPVYGGDVTDYDGNPLRQSFGMALKPVPLSGFAMIFYRLAL